MDKIGKYINRIRDKHKLVSEFTQLDSVIDSFDKSNLYVIAGRPGMGKTTLGLNIVYNLAINQKANVGIISYEMSEKQVLSRLLAISTEIPNYKILNGDLTNDEIELLKDKESNLNDSGIYIDCPSNLNFNNLKAKVLNLTEKSRLDFLYIDDLQRISISENDRKYAVNREQEVSKNVRDIKSLAKELNIPILAISQLNRDNKTRNTHRPILTDIRDSGAIENDSDVVLLLHRADYYGITEDEEGNSIIGTAELSIAKNRHGSVAQVRLLYSNEIPKYSNLVYIEEDVDDKFMKFKKMSDNFEVDNFIDLSGEPPF